MSLSSPRLPSPPPSWHRWRLVPCSFIEAALTFSLLLHLSAAEAAPPDPSAPAPDPSPTSAPVNAKQLPTPPSPRSSPTYQTTVVGHRPLPQPVPGRASTTVSRREMEERLPRSAPDALRFEPGVYVQQTAHAQGSAYIRGRTGQQTMLLFDGIRLNNSTFRQGPNQYFFTIDSRIIKKIEVLRGGASTIYGSDAMGGVINAYPLTPPFVPDDKQVHLALSPMLRYGSADQEIGGRLQAAGQLLAKLAFMGGVGYRRVGLLKAGGAITSPSTGQPPLVPRFEEDGVTQLGTNFKELTADGQLVYHLSPRTRLTSAIYAYRQLDAPRTDLCPPPYAPRGDCLTYEEQFRTIAYLDLSTALPYWARRLRLTLSWQNQHERRLYDRPSSFTANGGRDDVHTAGLVGHLETDRLLLGRFGQAKLRYGGDLYHDRLSSTAWTHFSDMEIVVRSSRGQYLDGSSYTWGGFFLQPELQLWRRLTLRSGGRFSVIAARAPADPESGTIAIDQTWTSLVGQLGLEYILLDGLSLVASLDRSFRAPNLDDLTSRQQTGPGFQFENSNLVPETALTLELGAQLDLGWLQLASWFFRTTIEQGIERSPRAIFQCPPQTPQCNASWSRFQLINLSDQALVYGAEGLARVFLPRGFSARMTVAYAYGYGPSPHQSVLTASRSPAGVPLSRIPPLNGTTELHWRHDWGLYAGLGVRWALTQTHLSLGDQSDERIPQGGTPGFAVIDLRAGFHLRRRLLLSLLLENLTNAAYRYHGSSVNGAGRGVILNIEGTMHLL